LCSIDSQVENDKFELNCSQFKDDYDILDQLPFSIVIDPDEDDYSNNTVFTYKNDTSVKEISIRNQDFFPPSVLCLSKLKELTIESTPFPASK
jgi:hypothetical protein